MQTDDTIAELGANRGDVLEIANEPGWRLVLLEDIPARRRGEQIDGGRWARRCVSWRRPLTAPT